MAPAQMRITDKATLYLQAIQLDPKIMTAREGVALSVLVSLPAF